MSKTAKTTENPPQEVEPRNKTTMPDIHKIKKHLKKYLSNKKAEGWLSKKIKKAKSRDE